MSKGAPPVIYRATIPPQILETTEKESLSLKTVKHTPTLNIDNKIALFENHAQATKDQRRTNVVLSKP